MAKLTDKRKKAPGAKPRKPAKPAKPLKPKKKALRKLAAVPAPPLLALGPSSAVLDRLHAVVQARKGGDIETSHSARLLSRGREKVAQKFGEEAVECLIEAVRGDRRALIGESADVLSRTIMIEQYPDRLRVRDTDGGADVERRIADLKKLLAAYRSGLVRTPSRME